MTTNKARKTAARQVAAATGQSYTAALRQLDDGPDLSAPACGDVIVVDDLAVFCDMTPGHAGNHSGHHPLGGALCTWADDAGEPEQCCAHDWASDAEREAGHISIHVCVLESGHDGRCVCVDCDLEFDGGLIADGPVSTARDTAGRLLPEWARS